MVHCYPWQQTMKELEGYSDSDWAGCRVTGKSTSGGVLMKGAHFIKSWSRTQQCVTLSSCRSRTGGDDQVDRRADRPEANVVGMGETSARASIRRQHCSLGNRQKKRMWKTKAHQRGPIVGPGEESTGRSRLQEGGGEMQPSRHHDQVRRPGHVARPMRSTWYRMDRWTSKVKLGGEELRRCSVYLTCIGNLR